MLLSCPGHVGRCRGPLDLSWHVLLHYTRLLRRDIAFPKHRSQIWQLFCRKTTPRTCPAGPNLRQQRPAGSLPACKPLHACVGCTRACMHTLALRCTAPGTQEYSAAVKLPLCWRAFAARGPRVNLQLRPRSLPFKMRPHRACFPGCKQIRRMEKRMNIIIISPIEEGVGRKEKGKNENI